MILALATALGVWNLAPRSQVESRPATHLTLNLVPTDRFANQGLALSPDGRVLVYVAMRDGVPYLFRRSMAERQPLLIAGTEGAFAPFFSPDGSSVGFYADDALKTVALAGGTPQTLCPAGTTGIYWGANWNDDGTITFSAGGGIKRVSAAGGVPQPITESSLLSGEEGEGIYQLGAHLLPGGRGMLFTSFASVLRADRIAVYSPGAEEHTDLLEGTSPHYVDSGHIVFARANTLWAVPFDLEQLEIRGEPTPLVEGIHVSSPGFGQFAVGEDGTLVYASSTPTRKLSMTLRHQGRSN